MPAYPPGNQGFEDWTRSIYSLCVTSGEGDWARAFGVKRIVSRNEIQFSAAALARTEKDEAEAKQDGGAGFRSLYKDNVVEVGAPRC